jgi:hypothetical protein
VSVIVDVPYNPVKGYSLKYTIGYIANTRNKYRNTMCLHKCYYIEIRRWVDNIKIDLRERGWDGMDWIDVPQDRDKWRALVNTVTNPRVP